MKKPVVMGVTGASAAGKTTLLKTIAEIMPSVSFVSMDNYYLPREYQQKDSNGVVNYDLPAAFDLAELKANLVALSNRKPIERKEYLFELDCSERESLSTPPADLIIVEGLFVFTMPDLDELWDYRVFLELPEPIRFARRLKRDVQERGLQEAGIIYQWKNHVEPANDRYVAPQKDKADLVLDMASSTWRSDLTSFLQRAVVQ